MRRIYLRLPAQFQYSGFLIMCLKTLMASAVLFVAAAATVATVQSAPNHHLAPDRLAQVEAMIAEAE